MNVETVYDVLEEICDRVGIYSDRRCDMAHDAPEDSEGWLSRDDHVADCMCRQIVIMDWGERLRAALVREQKLQSVGLL